MIKIEKTEVFGWEAAVRGMRNPLNSWHLSDSEFSPLRIGAKDLDLMLRLARSGGTHAKYRRMITVTVDITAPLYWWKEFDTYKVGTVANSCSTMHKIHSKPLTLADFSCERLWGVYLETLVNTIDAINLARNEYILTNDKLYWDQMIQLLPSSYNQRRTVMLNYEVLTNIYHTRKNHKLAEWHTLCEWIESLPYHTLIMGEGGEQNEQR